jgi:hypothetical protein
MEQSINDYIGEIISAIVNSESKTQYQVFSDQKEYNAAEMLIAHINGAATRQNEIIDILLNFRKK